MLQFFTHVLAPILFGCLCITAAQVLKRLVMKGKKISPLQFCIGAFAAATGMFGVIYVLTWGFSIPNVLPGFWSAVCYGSAANIAIQFMNAKAASIDEGEVSLTAPIQAMTPGLITVFALTLGEFPGTIGVLGVIFMMCGSYVLLWAKKPERWYEYFGPLQRLRNLMHLRELDAAERGKTIVVYLSLGSAAVGTVGLLFDGLYTRRSVNMQGIFLGAMAMTALLTAFYVLWYSMRPDATESQRREFSVIRTRGVWGFLVLWGLVWIAHIYFIQPTFAATFVAYVGTLKRFSILFSVLSGYFFFREKEFAKRLWASIFIIAGAICISLDEIPRRVADHMAGMGF